MLREDELATMMEDRRLLSRALDRRERQPDGAVGNLAVNDVRKLRELVVSSAEAIDGKTQKHREGIVIRMSISQRGRRDESRSPRDDLRRQSGHKAFAA